MVWQTSYPGDLAVYFVWKKEPDYTTTLKEIYTYTNIRGLKAVSLHKQASLINSLSITFHL